MTLRESDKARRRWGVSGDGFLTMSADPDKARRGFALAGTWIVDHLKIVDVLPNPGMLSNIFSEQMGTGGAPFNVLIQLGRLDGSLPLEAIGLVGDDDDGRWIFDQIRELSPDVSALKIRSGQQTSYTDVMTVKETGARTFFHLRGANSVFDVDDVPVPSLKGRIFHLGYLLLLTALDRADDRYGTRAARLLARCRDAGMLTSIDVASAEGGEFERTVAPALRHADYCIVNEVEAGGVVGRSLRDGADRPDWAAIEAAAREMARLGVRLNVTIHLPEGAVSLDVEQNRIWRAPSLALPKGFIKGAAGAGDAFCAGMLYGLHEGWEIDRSLQLAHSAAAASLRHPTCTGSVASMQEIRTVAQELREAS